MEVGCTVTVCSSTGPGLTEAHVQRRPGSATRTGLARRLPAETWACPSRPRTRPTHAGPSHRRPPTGRSPAAPEWLTWPVSALGRTRTSRAPSLTRVTENRGALVVSCPRHRCRHLLQLTAVEAEARHRAPVRRARQTGLPEALAAHGAHGGSCCGERRQAREQGGTPPPLPHCPAAEPAPRGLSSLSMPPVQKQRDRAHPSKRM